MGNPENRHHFYPDKITSGPPAPESPKITPWKSEVFLSRVLTLQKNLPRKEREPITTYLLELVDYQLNEGQILVPPPDNPLLTRYGEAVQDRRDGYIFLKNCLTGAVNPYAATREIARMKAQGANHMDIQRKETEQKNNKRTEHFAAKTLRALLIGDPYVGSLDGVPVQDLRKYIIDLPNFFYSHQYGIEKTYENMHNLQFKDRFIKELPLNLDIKALSPN